MKKRKRKREREREREREFMDDEEEMASGRVKLVYLYKLEDVCMIG